MSVWLWVLIGLVVVLGFVGSLVTILRTWQRR